MRLSVAGERDSVTHADATVDQDHGAADVRGLGLAMNRTTLATSSGSANRPAGMAVRYDSRTFSGSAWVISVSMNRG